MRGLKIDKTSNIISSFKMLKGNSRISVLCEPLWGIPFVIFNFYLSLYMKELGVTDKQLGYLISLGYISGTFFSFISGAVTDRFGRKKATLISDFISWPIAVVIYLISNSFIMFALATFINSFSRVASVSWNLMIIEDADDKQRVAAFNLLNIINISTGVIIPLAGIVVNAYGVIISERIFLTYAAFSMTAMVLLRNHLYRETAVGQRILDERMNNPVRINMKNIIPIKAAKVFAGNPKAIIAALVYILFLMYIPMGTVNSLYFAPFLTEVLKLEKSSISLLGGVYSGVMFVVLVFIIPVISKSNHKKNMMVGLVIQAAALCMLILIPAGSMMAAILSIALFASGFGTFKPFLDSMLAEVTGGAERAGIYSMVNTITCILTAFAGFVSGSFYLYNPRSLYIISVIILVICFILLGVRSRLKQKDIS